MKIQKQHLLIMAAPAILLLAIWMALISAQKTIAPVDIYKGSPLLYSQTNVLNIQNTFLTDIVEVYLPWKYYFTHFAPSPCETQIDNAVESQKFRGFMLPQKVCYPYDAVRGTQLLDGFYLIAPLTQDFFTAYDLTFALALAVLYGAGFFLFFTYLKENKTRDDELFSLAALGASFLTTSFMVARFLQFDEYLSAIILLVLSLGFLIFESKKKNARWYPLSASFLYFSIFSGSLQMLGLAPTLYLAFALVWAKPKRTPLLMTVVAACGLGFFHRFSSGSISLFLMHRDRFLPSYPTSMILLPFKRAAAFLISIVQVIWGDLFFGFKTIDFPKVLGPLGARDVYSSDNTSAFISPILTALLVLILSTGKKEAWHRHKKKLLLVLAIAFLSIELPLYRIFYFRLSAIWLTLSFILLSFDFFKAMDLSFSKKKATIFSQICILAPLIVIIASIPFRKDILMHLGQKGTFGAVPGYWEAHLDRWISQGSFGNLYSLGFTFTLIIALYLIPRRRFVTLSLLAMISGLLLNIFSYNAPQSREPFYQFIEAFEKRKGESIEERGKPLQPNVHLFFNLPADPIYESLYFLIPKEPLPEK